MEKKRWRNRRREVFIMNNSPTLVVMAAGLGSRFGGLKQLEPVTDSGEHIIDFTVHDACRAGFERVVFIINKSIESEFKRVIGDKLAEHIQVDYVFQELEQIPEGFEVPAGRKKPYGTGHAILTAASAVDGSFAVVNADDYYGIEPFFFMHKFLSETGNDTGRESGSESRADDYAMVAYKLANTISEHGSVSRGVCRVSESGFLENIEEKTQIIKRGDKIVSIEQCSDQTGCENQDKSTADTVEVELSPDQPVSMNFWGFKPDLFADLGKRFEEFLRNELPDNPAKAEFYLNDLLNEKIAAGSKRLRVFTTQEKWFGITYKEDKPAVVAALESMAERGLYNKPLW
jgi:NDP-sugar pyrophosphorylase family protein